MSPLNDKKNPFFFFQLNAVDELTVKFMLRYINRPDFKTLCLGFILFDMLKEILCFTLITMQKIISRADKTKLCSSDIGICKILYCLCQPHTYKIDMVHTHKIIRPFLNEKVKRKAWWQTRNAQWHLRPSSLGLHFCLKKFGVCTTLTSACPHNCLLFGWTNHPWPTHRPAIVNSGHHHHQSSLRWVYCTAFRSNIARSSRLFQALLQKHWKDNDSYWQLAPTAKKQFGQALLVIIHCI